MPKNCQIYFIAVILISKTEQENGDLSIAPSEGYLRLK